MGHSGVLNATRTLQFSPGSEAGVSSTLMTGVPAQNCLTSIVAHTGHFTSYGNF